MTDSRPHARDNASAATRPAGAPAPGSPEDAEIRIGRAWRELRRGASMQRLRNFLLGDFHASMDLGQLDTLELLAVRGSMRMSELAGAMRIDNSSATRAVARLVDMGLADRRTSPDDGRGVDVQATPAGIDVWSHLAPRRRDTVHQMLTTFSAQERQDLADLLDRLVASLDEFVAAQDPQG